MTVALPIPAPVTTTYRPLGMLAELTHACPLHCAYCSNPLALTSRDTELSTAEWTRVFREAAALGVVQVHLSGGEPLLRKDLRELTLACREAGLYTNLITSAIGLDRERLAGLAVDHVQISVQDATAERASLITGAGGFGHKLAAAALVKEAGLPLTVNVVLHRHNLDRIADLIALAEKLGADRLELANTQYYGWAERNRRWLLPTAEQIAAADVVVREAGERLDGRIDISYVRPDLHAGVPKPCMGGWGQRQLTVAPGGDVLPCPVAAELPDMPLENVRHRSLAAIWHESASFNRFRGTAWMREPCLTCDRRDIDYGGCRCQAYQFTGDPTVTDPACRYSPHRPLVDAVLAEAASEQVEYRPHAPRRSEENL
jgi:pyrroloquinoline quinone biosynthesis protein E